jgi:hypothetical protein
MLISSWFAPILRVRKIAVEQLFQIARGPVALSTNSGSSGRKNCIREISTLRRKPSSLRFTIDSQASDDCGWPGRAAVDQD